MPKNNIVLAIDYGLSRIGIAQGDLNLKIAHPIKTIKTKKQDNQIYQINQMILEWDPSLLVIGMPLHMDGKKHNLTNIIENFAIKLNKTFSLDIYLVDERLTSFTAKYMLKDSGIYGKKQKDYIDQISAVEILKTFFENGYIKKYKSI